MSTCVSLCWWWSPSCFSLLPVCRFPPLTQTYQIFWVCLMVSLTLAVDPGCAHLAFPARPSLSTPASGSPDASPATLGLSSSTLAPPSLFSLCQAVSNDLSPSKGKQD